MAQVYSVKQINSYIKNMMRQDFLRYTQYAAEQTLGMAQTVLPEPSDHQASRIRQLPIRCTYSVEEDQTE